MTQHAPSREAALQAQVTPGSAARHRPTNLPGGRVVTVATLIVIAAALVEAVLRDRIGPWTGSTLLLVSVVAPLVTRKGDRSLPAMMPPLAFLAATLTAGQLLLPTTGGALRTREAVMIAGTLGANASWVVAATIASATIAAIRHLRDR